MTMLDLLLSPKTLADARVYFDSVQTKDVKYKSFLTDADQPPIELNRETMAKYRDQMRKYYYVPAKYKTYLDQLGIKYPTVRPDSAKPAGVIP